MWCTSRKDKPSCSGNEKSINPVHDRTKIIKTARTIQKKRLKRRLKKYLKKYDGTFYGTDIQEDTQKIIIALRRN